MTSPHKTVHFVPVLSGDVETQIASPVLQANRLRDEDWRAERDMIQELVGRIEHKRASNTAFGAALT